MKLIRNKPDVVGGLILLALIAIAGTALALAGREVGLYILLLMAGAVIGKTLVHLAMRRWGARKRVALLALAGAVVALILVPLVGLWLGVNLLLDLLAPLRAALGVVQKRLSQITELVATAHGVPSPRRIISALMHYATPTASARRLTVSTSPSLSTSIGNRSPRYGLGLESQYALPKGEARKAARISANPSTTPPSPSGSNCKGGNRKAPRSMRPRSVPAFARSCGVWREVPSSSATSGALKAPASTSRRRANERANAAASNEARSPGV